jgi:hypothetical protein
MNWSKTESTITRTESESTTGALNGSFIGASFAEVRLKICQETALASSPRRECWKTTLLRT